MIKVEPNNYESLRFVLSSGDDEYPGCNLNITFLRWNITVDLPPIIKPDVLKVRGQFNYDEFIERQYGTYLFENHFNIIYGRGDANFHRDIFGEEQRWSCFLPWSEWRHIRHSLYGLQGEHLYSQFNKDKMSDRFDIFYKEEQKTPKVVFSFFDFDGEEIEATTHIEEREWHRGEGIFRWLSFFFAPKINRSLDIQFDKETGKRKGSWKGGILGHGINMKLGELHEEAFRRYCQQNNMKFNTK